MSNLEVYPSGYDTDRTVYASALNLENAFTSSSSDTYAQYNLKTGGSANTYVYLTFDLSSIPQNATINSVACTARAFINNTTSSRIATRQMQLFSNDTAKGTPINIEGSATIQNLDVGQWTREELDGLSLRLYAKRGSSSTSTNYYIRFMGATLTIEYQSGGVTQTLKLKSNGEWSDVSKVYKKENGSWAEVQDISQEFDVNANYFKEN